MMTTRVFRYLLSTHQIWLLIILFQDSWGWLGKNQMVTIRTPGFPTFLDLFNFNGLLIDLFLVATLFLWLLFAFNLLPRVGQIILFVFSVSIHNANPYIIHEPQQMVNLLLFIQIFFLPVDNKANINNKVHLVISLYLGAYYFLAGLKKIPDINWLNGEALKIILMWPPFYKDNWISQLLLQNEFLLKMLTWFTIVFELTFGFLIFTRFKMLIFLIGVIFHFFIFTTMEVGTFSLIMLVWYSLVFPVEEYFHKIKLMILKMLKVNAHSKS